ncbi:MAG: outer membrane beta-barrel protein [Bacteroidales bacterium]|nr:outer membrane beta-barrel protein [Bacteroidales bacterium]
MRNLYDSSHDIEMINRLKSIEVTPPIGLWDDIEATLLAKRKRKIFIITSWASAATIAILFTIGGFYYVNVKEIDIASNNQKKSEINKLADEKVNIKSLDSKVATDKIEKHKVDLNEINRNVVLNSNTTQTIENLEDSKRYDEIPSKIQTIQSKVKKSNVDVVEQLHIISESNQIDFNEVIAQVEPAKKDIGKWYVAASGFPVYSFHTYGAISRSDTRQESGIVSWGGSISIRYAFSNKFSIESGLTYSTIGQQEKNIFLLYTDPSNTEVTDIRGISNSYGVLTIPNTDLKVMDMGILNILSTPAINASSIYKANAYQRFRYIEMPVILARSFNLKSVRFTVKSGLSVGYLIDNKLQVSGSNFKLSGKTRGVAPFAPSALASLGFSIPITNRANLLIEPTFRLGLKSLYLTNSKTYPFSTFIKFGVEVPF